MGWKCNPENCGCFTERTDKMIYLTYNDYPSGIYSSQVSDVCDFLNERIKLNIRLVAFISLRKFSVNKSKIKTENPSAIVLPMFPGVQNWAWNSVLMFFLCIFLRKQSVIARGPFAASISMMMRKIRMVGSVCFDARGAYEAEFREYNVSGNKALERDIFSIERNALINSDFRIAVSNQLVEYWRKKFGYNKNEHVVVPCTLNSKVVNMVLEESMIHNGKSSLGFSDDDIIFVYSGSSSGWQSLHLVDNFLIAVMKSVPRAKVLFLVDGLPDNMKVVKDYPGRVCAKWLQREDVPGVLSSCDYGLLIREESLTNQVASPVKFAEYLASGLKVIISGHVGDFSEFVRVHGCGYVINSGNMPDDVHRLSLEEKHQNRGIAEKYFLKVDYLKEYTQMCRSLS